MNYPPYVPAAVRAHITTLIEGDEWAPGVPWADTVEVLQRLAHDSRMSEAYALLTSEVSNDEQWCGFINAAWKAQMDYVPYRERLRRAAELKERIADAAIKLADLIRQFSETGVDGPGEFYSVPELLRKTDNDGPRVGSLTMWRAMRGRVLGDLPRRDAQQPQENGDSTSARKIEIHVLGPDEKPQIDPVEAERNALFYAWEQAPPFSALLGTVAEAARAFKPSEYGMIGAATQTRQRSVKTAYLRAFAHVLTDSHYFKLTTAVMNAMAIVANVAINQPDVDVTSDDVRKALARLGGEPLENSNQK